MGKTIQIGKTVYTVLFPDLMRPLTERERQDLKNSIRQDGIRSPVIVDSDNGIIDGANRAEIAAELGHSSLFHKVERILEPEKKLALALSLNLDRRHLSRKERQAQMETRRQRVEEARKKGKSVRQIAKEEGVSHTQIEKDLESSSCSTGNLLPVEQDGQSESVIPVMVMGVDGKERPAKRATEEEVEARRRRVEEARAEGKSVRAIAAEEGVSVGTVTNDMEAVQSDAGDDEGRQDEQPVDGAGQPLTPALASTFRTAMEFDEIVKTLRAVQSRIGAVAGQPGAEWLRSSLQCERHGDSERWKSPDVANVISALQHFRPYAVCPCCRQTVKPGCEACRGLGWITEAVHGRLPDRLKQPS